MIKKIDTSSAYRPCLKILGQKTANMYMYVCTYMSLVMRKLVFCLCENKDADQLRGNHKADQRLCFRCLGNTIPLLPKSEISKLKASPEVAQPGVCNTWSETLKTDFLMTRLIYHRNYYKIQFYSYQSIYEPCLWHTPCLKCVPDLFFNLIKNLDCHF